MAVSSHFRSTRHIEQVLDEVYAWSGKQGYRGYNKHDGLNSPLLRPLLGWARWPRLVAIQGVMRFPLNLRPLLLIPKTYNPKGLALFALGLLDRYRFSKNEQYLSNAQKLLDLLLEQRSPGDWSGYCWGYHYPWQDVGFFAPTNTPNAVVTSFVCEAFVSAYRVTGEQRYLDVLARVIPFFVNDLTVLKDTDEELCLGYMPLPMTIRVLDVSILIGSVLSQYVALSGDSTHARTAQRLVRFVIHRQTDYAAWFYTDPPGDSHIRHDNYHTGFILDALWRYMSATSDWTWEDLYWRGLQFYASNLFNADGSPRWMSDRDYPHDIHGAAQGIITFSRHSDIHPDLPFRIADWALGTMYSPDGRFYYQQTPFFRKRFTLLRWCNAWMARGLSALLIGVRESKTTAISAG